MTAAPHVLVVDDEPGIVRLCKRLLKGAGYTVATYTDPKEAIAYVAQNRVDLLVVDIRMPEISGFDLIGQVQQNQPDVAVLVMTGFGTVEIALQALRQGVDGLLLKPFESDDQLVRAAQQALEDSQKRHDIVRIQALRPIFDIAETFLAETNPERLVELILNAVCGHLNCECAAYYQYSTEDHRLVLMAKRGDVPPVTASNPEGDLIGRTDALGGPLWVNAMQAGEADLQATVINQGLSSVLSAPISRFNVRGVLCAGRKMDRPPFREVEWEMFLLLARQAAIAMENARLYEELREYVRRVENSQQALLRAEKMASAGRLTASIAHEINNPMQAVQNCLHLATRSELSEEQKSEYIELAKKELGRLMNTVQRMLEFYRPGVAEPQRMDVVKLLQHVIGLISPQLQARGIRVRTGFSSKLSPILVMSSQLEQVFINLILNAYDAMPNGGELHISARPVKDMIEILIQDTGPGIPVEMRSHIFEPFVSTKEGGTGLGLPVSYGIVTAHGGSLDLLPDRGPGACFRVMLPAKGEV